MKISSPKKRSSHIVFARRLKKIRCFSGQNKADLFLVSQGTKPAAWIIKGDLPGIHSQADKLRDALKASGLAFSMRRIRMGYRIFAARNSKLLSHLIKAVKKKDHREIGIALGYPQRAVEAFCRNEASSSIYD